MKRWEYIVRHCNTSFEKDGIDVMNDLGAQGWELVTIVANEPNYADSEYVFKRPME